MIPRDGPELRGATVECPTTITSWSEEKRLVDVALVCCRTAGITPLLIIPELHVGLFCLLGISKHYDAVLGVEKGRARLQGRPPSQGPL